MLKKRRKARLSDALIAQTCIDRGISLITHDPAFAYLAKPQGLTRSPVRGCSWPISGAEREGMQGAAEVIRPLHAEVWRAALKKYSRNWPRG